MGQKFLSEWVSQKRLGRGSTVQLVQHSRSGEFAVLKSLNLSMLNDWKSVELFEREAATLGSIKHPHIPKLIAYTADSDAQQFHTLQEYFDVPSLAGRRDEAWPEDRLLTLAASTLEVLEYLHSQSPPVIHRDIEPANVLFDDDGQAFIVDFGGVQRLVAKRVGGSTIVGTSGYMAPEQFVGGAVPSSDLFGLGMVMISLATGLDASRLASVGLRPKWRGEQRSKLSKSTCDFIDKLVSPDPGGRPDNAMEALRELDLILRQRSTPVARPPNMNVTLLREPDRLTIETPAPPFSAIYLYISLSTLTFPVLIFEATNAGWLSLLALPLAVVPILIEGVRVSKRNRVEFTRNRIRIHQSWRKPIDVSRREFLKMSPGQGAEERTLFMATVNGMVPIAQNVRPDVQTWMAAEIEHFWDGVGPG